MTDEKNLYQIVQTERGVETIAEGIFLDWGAGRVMHQDITKTPDYLIGSLAKKAGIRHDTEFEYRVEIIKKIR